MLMVKPTLPYLDIVTEARDLAPDHPLACYQVSGEFAMIHAGAKAGVYELRRMAEESVQSMVRAGANIILSYFTPDFLDVSTNPLALMQACSSKLTRVRLVSLWPCSGSMNPHRCEGAGVQVPVVVK